MKIPVLKGVIKRRILVNFRVDAAVMQRLLPAPLRPKLHQGFAIAGICLIRLERIRPDGFPDLLGVSSENAAHRVAIEWNHPSGQPNEGVFISRRDTNSRLAHLAGGRIFSGEHQLASFRVRDNEAKVDFAMQSRDQRVSVLLRGFDADSLPSTSCFASLAESSRFFETGSVGFSATSDAHRLDGLRLKTLNWRVRALDVEDVAASYFANARLFPAGSATFDHALIMRDTLHEWHQVPDMLIVPAKLP